LAHVEEWLDEAGDYLQYKPFLKKADGNFVLRAKGKPDVHCQASGSFITSGSEKLRDFEIVIPPEEFAKMARGVAYTLHPSAADKEYGWAVKPELRVTRTATADEKMDAILERLDRLERRVLELEKENASPPR
jgi:hypothetical protein